VHFNILLTQGRIYYDEKGIGTGHILVGKIAAKDIRPAERKGAF